MGPLQLYGSLALTGAAWIEGDVDGVMDRPAGDGDDNLAELRKWCVVDHVDRLEVQD